MCDAKGLIFLAHFSFSVSFYVMQHLAKSRFMKFLERLARKSAKNTDVRQQRNLNRVRLFVAEIFHPLINYSWVVESSVLRRQRYQNIFRSPGFL